MNKWMLLFFFAGTVCADIRNLTPEEIKARVSGASACEYLRVVDEKGLIVTNATVEGNFHMNDGKGNPFAGRTDTNGIYEAAGKCVGDWHYVLSKDGYYETSGGGNYRKTGVKHGCWQPYGMTNTAVLKRMVNPVAMYVRRGMNQISLPVQNEWVGFDLERSDWTSPHGSGKHEDFQVFFILDLQEERWLYYKYSLTLRFPNAFDGFYRMRKDETGSSFRCVYEADTNRLYASEITFTSERRYDTVKNRSVAEDVILEPDDYLVLRVRSETDKEGRLVKANYAKLCAPLFAARYGFLIESYFNPNVNDPNLEADTIKNLRDSKDLGFAP